VKLNKATKSIDRFIEEAFDKNGYKEKEYKANSSKWNCSFCPFLNTEHCSEGVNK
jgi:hypothetical protein